MPCTERERVGLVGEKGPECHIHATHRASSRITGRSTQRERAITHQNLTGRHGNVQCKLKRLSNMDASRRSQSNRVNCPYSPQSFEVFIFLYDQTGLHCMELTSSLRTGGPFHEGSFEVQMRSILTECKMIGTSE